MNPAEWRLSSGGQMINSGCWTEEPRINSTEIVSPYRPGRGVLVTDSGPPQQLLIAEQLGERPITGF